MVFYIKKYTMKIFSILLFLFGITHFYGQEYTIIGTVVDFHDKSPLSHAQVSVGKYNTTTDNRGEFKLTKVKPGTYTVKVNHADCEEYRQEILVTNSLHLAIVLEHHIAEIETVTLHRKHKDNGSMVVSTINQKEIARNSTENLGNLLSKLSGVSTLKTGNNIAKPIINGMYGDRISIMNNGVKLADQEWGVEHAPNVEINNFEHIDVVKGASTLKYGMNSVGGVVILEPEVFPKKDTLKGVAKVSGISNGRGLALDLGVTKTWENQWAVKTRGGYTLLGDLSAPDYGLMNTGTEKHSFGLSVQNNSFLRGVAFDYYFTQQRLGIFRGSDLGNLNDFYTAITSEVPIYTRKFSYKIDNPMQEIQHHIAKLSAFKRLDKWGKLSVDYSFQYNNRKEMDLRRGDLSKIPAMELDLFTNQLNINDFIEREKWSLDLGIQSQYQYNYSPVSTQAKRLIPNYHQYNLGFYSVFKYKLMPNFEAEIGGRWDYQKDEVKAWYDAKDWEEKYAQDFSNFYVETVGNRVFTKPILDYYNLGMNAGLSWKPKKDWQWTINYSQVGRVPNIAELFAGGLHHSAAMIEEGDLTLKKERYQQVNMSLDFNFPFLQGLHLNVNPYYSSIQNYITQLPTGIQNTIRGVFPVWSYKQVDAEMFGIAAQSNWKLTDYFKWNSNFSYLYGQDLSHQQALPLMVPMQLSNAVEFQFPWRKLLLKVEHQWVGEQKRFPVYNPSLKIFENGVEVDKTLDLSTPPPAYQLWNSYLEMEVVKNFMASISVTNLFDVAYKNYLNRMRFFSHEMGRNITIGLQFKF